MPKQSAQVPHNIAQVPHKSPGRKVNSRRCKLLKSPVQDPHKFRTSSAQVPHKFPAISPTSQIVLDLLTSSGVGLTAAEIMKKTSIPRRTMYDCLNQLVKNNVITPKGHFPKVYYKAINPAKKVEEICHTKNKFVIQKKCMTQGGLVQTIYNLLVSNPILKYVIKHTGKDRRVVAKYLKRLEEGGYIKRIDRGVYKVLKCHTNSPKVVLPCHTNSKEQGYFRLHNLEVEIGVTKDQYNIIKNTIFKNSQFYKLRPFGKVGHYFTLDVTGLLTKEKLFMMMPEGWEQTYSSTSEMYAGIYEVIEQTSIKWQEKFKTVLVKGGRLNLRIVNCHVAYIKGDLCREFTNKADFKYVMIRDDQDNKPRFVMDLSPGFIEFEFLHPQKQLIDAKEAEFFGKTLINGSYQKLFNDIQAKPYIPLSEISVYMANTAFQINEVSHGLKAVVDYLNLFIPKETEEEPKGKPPYIG